MKVVKRTVFPILTILVLTPVALLAQIEWTEHTVDGNFDGAWCCYAADIDSDGDMDVLGASYLADDITWWENDGDEDFTEHTIEGNFDNTRFVYAIDVDSDGDMDVLGAALDADDITWWENDGEEDFTGHTIEGDLDGAYAVIGGDIDSDGDVDVFGSAFNASSFTWWENDGDEHFTEHLLADEMDWAVSVFMTDFEGDGDMDLFGAGGTRDDGYIIWWENDGNENFTEHALTTEFAYAHTVFVVDFDGDGDNDVLGAAYEGDEVAWWENDGEGEFEEHSIAAFNGVQGVHAADIDFDGDIDVVGASRALSRVEWWENDIENQDEWTEYTIDDNFNNARFVYCVDMDNDADIDVLCAAYVEDEIAWYENDTDPPGDSNVEGIVTDAGTEEPVEGAEVTFRNLTETTDEEGYYRIEGLHPDLHTVTIEADGYETYTEAGIEIEDGENLYDFQIEPRVSVSGTITDSETGDAIEDAMITFGGELYFAVTDEEGFYSIDDFESGIYDVLIEADGYFDYEEDDIEVEEPENVLDYAIDILSGDLTGVISEDRTNDLLFGATVFVIDPETNEIYREVQTNEDGEYIIEMLHDGIRYLVTAEHEDYAPADTEEVLIHWDQDNEQDFELTPFDNCSIRAMQQETVGPWVVTSGIVTQGTNTTDTEHTNIYIQDDSGWGIKIFDENPTDPENNFNRGDDVTVTGYLTEVDDITRIINFEIEVISNDNALPDPRVESTGDMSRLNQREGTWAQISGQINRNPPEDGNYSLIINDGSGQCEVRIVESTGIDLSEYSADDFGTFTGIISLSRQGLRIIPNMQEDVERSPIYPPADLTTEQEVIQGDPLRLEVTLGWAHDHLDDWIRFKIYRDDVFIRYTEELTWSETHANPNPGEYETYIWTYSVTAEYDVGETEHSNEVEVVWDITPVNERPYSEVPTEWSLEAVYPNPFNPELHIVLGVPQVADVTLEIFDILGRNVAILHHGEMNPAWHRFNWNAKGYSTGLYFLHVSNESGFNGIRKVMYLK
ncbi:MAG: carboxypeptidase regulatory-like domain-containing protein [Candidatus Electryonea clarkiae]|nr:carboxypeptidase regulatory-like domain-containing protein [Candidatus Electryonea clarkiae]MDP8285138.1 carboxypeptidase regulatory-like domain-containing protein [Candidatus Electryonea clarkiae]